MILVVHVDDIFAVGKKERCDQFGEDLNRMVPVKNLGELKWYSGCFYERDREAGRLKISQQTYTKELGEKFDVKWGGSIPMGYAVRTSSWGITFQRGTVEGFHLVSFADADYASKATDRRSVSGGVVM